MIRSLRGVTALLLGTVILTSCGQEALPVADPFGDGAWRLVAGMVDGAAVGLVDTHTVTLAVDDRAVVGRSACNQYRARVRIEGDGMTIDEISMTEMACLDEGVMDLEAAYVGALARVGRVSVEGEHLILTGDGVTLRFEPVAPEPDAALLDTPWTLDTLIESETASTPAGDAWIRFSADGTVTGHNGCNGFGGEYGPDHGFSDLYQTLIGCLGPVAAQETLVMGVLGAGPILAIEGALLTISAPDGRALVFRASSE